MQKKTFISSVLFFTSILENSDQSITVIHMQFFSASLSVVSISSWPFWPKQHACADFHFDACAIITCCFYRRFCLDWWIQVRNFER